MLIYEEIFDILAFLTYITRYVNLLSTDFIEITSGSVADINVFLSAGVSGIGIHTMEKIFMILIDTLRVSRGVNKDLLSR